MMDRNERQNLKICITGEMTSNEITEKKHLKIQRNLRNYS